MVLFLMRGEGWRVDVDAVDDIVEIDFVDLNRESD